MRTFIAFEIDENIKKKIHQIAKEFKKNFYSVKLSSKENIHLTMRFLGNISEEEFNIVKEKLSSYNGRKSQEVILDELGFFPSRFNPKIVWIGSKTSYPYLEEIYNDFRDSFNSLNIGEKEFRNFKLHITIARVKKKLVIPKEYSLKFEPIKLTLNKLTIFKSDLTKEGPIYTPLYTANLR